LTWAEDTAKLKFVQLGGVKRHSFYLKPGEKRRVKEALVRKRNRKKARKEQD